jgi:hypothetical protein
LERYAVGDSTPENFTGLSISHPNCSHTALAQ